MGNDIAGGIVPSLLSQRHPFLPGPRSGLEGRGSPPRGPGAGRGSVARAVGVEVAVVSPYGIVARGMGCGKGGPMMESVGPGVWGGAQASKNKKSKTNRWCLGRGGGRGN